MEKLLEKLLEKLNKKFDKYHQKQMEIDDNQNPDYYLFMGKANAIGEVIDEIEKIKNKPQPFKATSKN